MNKLATQSSITPAFSENLYHHLEMLDNSSSQRGEDFIFDQESEQD